MDSAGFCLRSLQLVYLLYLERLLAIQQRLRSWERQPLQIVLEMAATQTELLDRQPVRSRDVVRHPLLLCR